MTRVDLIPVLGPDLMPILYDMFVDGVWIGSQRTVDHCSQRLLGKSFNPDRTDPLNPKAPE